MAFAGLLTVFLQACSGLGVLDALTPTAGYVASTDIAFGDGPRRMLDIYAPPAAAGAPVAIFWYGGSWASGGKAQYRFVAEAMVRRGFVIVLPDYRLTPEARFPDFVDDTVQAADWTLANIARFGGDSRRILLIGHSAGAYNATMAVLGRRIPSDRIAGVVAISGPADFDPKKGRALNAAFGHVGDVAATQPLTFAKSLPTADLPPFLMLHGETDAVVAPRQSAALAAAIREGGGRAQAVFYPATGHADIMLGLTSNFAGDLRVLDAIVEFQATSLRRAASDGD